MSNTSRLTIDMDPEEHKKLKALAALKGTTIKNLVLSCVVQHLLSDRSPNKETIKAFEETEKKENVVTCKDVDDLLQDLGL